MVTLSELQNQELNKSWFSPQSGWCIFDDGSGLLLFNPGSLNEHRLEGSFASELRTVLNDSGELDSNTVKKLEFLLSNEEGGILEEIQERRFTENPSPAEILALESPRQLWIELQGSCNEECLHCYARSAPTDLPKLDVDTVRSMIRAASELDFSLIQFTGGDPLLWEELPEVLNLTRDEGITPEVYTNGLLLDRDLYETILPARPRFAFSLYSHEKDVHDRITQHPGSWERTMEAIERAVNGPTRVRVGVVIMDENVGHEESTKELLKSKGVDPSRIRINYVQEVGRGQAQERKEVNNQKEKPSGESEEQGGENQSGGGHLTGQERTFNPGKLCVSYRGEVLPCIFQRDLSLGSIHDRSLDEIVREPRIREGMSSDPDTTQEPHDPDRLTCPECRFHSFLLRYVRNGR